MASNDALWMNAELILPPQDEYCIWEGMLMDSHFESFLRTMDEVNNILNKRKSHCKGNSLKVENRYKRTRKCEEPNNPLSLDPLTIYPRDARNATDTVAKAVTLKSKAGAFPGPSRRKIKPGPKRFKTSMELTPFLNLPQREAANKVGISQGALSRKWKKCSGGKPWPFRELRKKQREIEKLRKHKKRTSDTRTSDILQVRINQLQQQQEELQRPCVIYL